MGIPRAERSVPPGTGPVPGGWWLDGLLLLLLAGLTAGLAVESPLIVLDVQARNFFDAHRPSQAHQLARILNHLGQGLPLTLLCLGLAWAHVWRQRTYEPLLPVVSAFVMSYVSIGLLKFFTDRGAPHYGSALLFSEPSEMSYPSGHASNAVVWYGVLTMLLAPWAKPWLCRLIRWVPLVIVAFATTYLGYHWASDTAAGLLLGVMITRVVTRGPWRCLRLPQWRLAPRSRDTTKLDSG